MGPAQSIFHSMSWIVPADTASFDSPIPSTQKLCIRDVDGFWWHDRHLRAEFAEDNAR